MVSLVPFNNRRDLFNPGWSRSQNMLDDFFADFFPYRRSLAWDTFKIDVEEQEKEYVVEAELSGVTKDEINVSLEEGRLNISVNKEENVATNNKNYIHKERRYSSMSRNVFLADAAEEGIKAKLQDGVLSVTVPKKEKTNHYRKIEIE